MDCKCPSGKLFHKRTGGCDAEMSVMWVADNVVVGGCSSTQHHLPVLSVADGFPVV